MIRILHIAQKYGGNYPLFNDMVRLDRRKFESYFCYLRGVADGLNEMDRLAQAVFYDFGKQQRFFFKKLKSAHVMANIIDKHDIDIVNCQREKTMPLGVLASFLSKRKPKIAVTVHGLAGGQRYDLRRKIKNSFYYRFLDKVICISETVKKDVTENNVINLSGKVVVVHNGLACEKFLFEMSKEEARRNILPDSKSGFFWFGTVGRLSEVKNQERLILAFGRVLNRRPNCLLLIAGDGPLKKKLSSAVADLGLSNHVLFLGNRSDVPVILKALDVFVFPSLREGFGLALLEAMASKIPIVASDIPIFREIAGDSDIGRLADPYNPVALADAMSMIMDLPQDELKNMGERAQCRAISDFSAAKMIRNYEALYEQIIGGGMRPFRM